MPHQSPLPPHRRPRALAARAYHLYLPLYFWCERVVREALHRRRRLVRRSRRGRRVGPLVVFCELLAFLRGGSAARDGALPELGRGRSAALFGGSPVHYTPGLRRAEALDPKIHASEFGAVTPLQGQSPRRPQFHR